MKKCTLGVNVGDGITQHECALSKVGVVNGSLLNRACLAGATSDPLVISGGAGFRATSVTTAVVGVMVHPQ